MNLANVTRAIYEQDSNIIDLTKNNVEFLTELVSNFRAVDEDIDTIFFSADEDSDTLFFSADKEREQSDDDYCAAVYRYNIDETNNVKINIMSDYYFFESEAKRDEFIIRVMQVAHHQLINQTDARTIYIAASSE